MNKFSKLELIATCRRQTGSVRAFTLTELLVVVGTTALLATVLLSAAFTTQERALRAECVSNLRQIGVDLNIYSTEANDYLPFSGWKQITLPSGSPWETYLACRYSGVGQDVATGGIVEGPYGLASLFFTKAIPNGKTFYCPANPSGLFNYNSYNEAGWPWPAIPPDIASLIPGFNGNAYVRCGYSYYAQSRILGPPSATYGGPNLPTVTTQRVTFTSPNPNDSPQPPIVVPAALKITAINPKKSIATDIVDVYSDLSHRASGSAVGLNALFPDGHVTFQTVRNHNKKNSYQPFDPNLWGNSGNGFSTDTDSFRIIVNGLVP
jgi:type II secretory pathway pseudopilin PulG